MCVYVCVCIYIYIYIYTYDVYIYIYTHTHLSWQTIVTTGIPNTPAISCANSFVQVSGTAAVVLFRDFNGLQATRDVEKTMEIMVLLHGKMVVNSG